LKRRSFVHGLLGGTLWPAAGIWSRRAQAGHIAFRHGIASGDPLTDRVILWTRVSGAEHDVDVNWQVASDPAMRQVRATGDLHTGPERDFTVKVDVEGLQPGRAWYYRFAVDAGGDRIVQSPVGRTRTLPTGHVESARFAVASCANYPYGYFHAYRDIARDENLDAVVHLGDYLYEYGMGEYGSERAEALGRIPDPPHETLTLDDMRRRHAQYKTDPDLQALHAAHPLIAVWDDHELANDAWKDGAQNHVAGEGDWYARRDAAIQAWLEWMPVRAGHEQADTRIYRQFRFGDLATLVMLDTRIAGRDRQPDAEPGAPPEAITAALGDPERRLLGARQEAWLRDVLREATTTWQLLGQQVMVSPTLSPSLEPLLDTDKPSMLSPEELQHYIAASRDNPPLLLDTWNGYPLARSDLLADLAQLASNPVILTGDLHTSLAANLYGGDGGALVAVELMTGSISSPGFAEYLPERRPGAVRDATMELNPGLVYMETDRRGWLKVELTHEACVAEWRLLDSVHERDWSISADRRLTVAAGRIGEGLVPA
jgi:alkaline phosphatase D